MGISDGNELAQWVTQIFPIFVPAKELALFNEHIIGEITPVQAFFGEQFVMPENTLVADEIINLK